MPVLLHVSPFFKVPCGMFMWDSLWGPFGYVPGAGEIESLTSSMVEIILTKVKLGSADII